MSWVAGERRALRRRSLRCAALSLRRRLELERGDARRPLVRTHTCVRDIVHTAQHSTTQRRSESADETTPMRRCHGRQLALPSPSHTAQRAVARSPRRDLAHQKHRHAHLEQQTNAGDMRGMHESTLALVSRGEQATQWQWNAKEQHGELEKELVCLCSCACNIDPAREVSVLSCFITCPAAAACFCLCPCLCWPRLPRPCSACAPPQPEQHCGEPPPLRRRTEGRRATDASRRHCHDQLATGRRWGREPPTPTTRVPVRRRRSTGGRPVAAADRRRDHRRRWTVTREEGADREGRKDCKTKSRVRRGNR